MAIKSFLSEGGFSVGSVGATPVEVIDSSGNITAGTISGSNLTLSGNLIVNGSTTTINSTTLTADDVILTLGGDTAPASDDNKDRGIEFRWHNGTQAKVGFFGFDDSTGYFTFIPDATNTSEVFSGTQGDIQVSNLRSSNVITTGDVSANTVTAGGAYTTRITGTGGGAYIYFGTSGGNSLGQIGRFGSLMQFDSDTPFAFRYQGADLVRITTGGNVGIGTTAPGAKLTVGPSFVTSVGLTVDSNSGTDSQLILRKTAAKAAHSVLAWDNDVYIGAGTYYNNGSWVHHNNTANSQLLVMGPGTGVNWYTSSNNTSTWNVASNVWLWNDAGSWKSLVQSTASGNSFFTGGNLGVGTSSPAYRLDVVDNSTGIQTRLSSSSTFGTSLQFINSAANGRSWRIGHNFVVGGGEFSIYDDTAAATRIHISTAGNVGVGTTSPTQKLDVAGHVASTSSGGNPNFRAVDGSIITKLQSQSVGDTTGAIGTESNHTLKLITNNTARVTIDTSGYVGVGTTSPAALLNILAGSGSANGVVALRIGSTANYATLELGTGPNEYAGFIRTYGNDLHYYAGHFRTVGSSSSEDHSHFWYTSKNGSTNWSTAKMTLNQDGNLGIGTTSPAYKLDVAGTIRSNTSLFTTNGTSATWDFTEISSTGTTSIYNAGGAESGISFRFDGTERVFFANSGNVGIGTSSPQYNLEISGAAATNGVARIGSIDYGSSTVLSVAPGVINFDAAGVVGGRFKINSSGKVGINNTTPTYTLDVGGPVRTNDWFYVDGSGYGIYNNANSLYFSSNSVGHWNISSNQTFAGLRLYSGGHTTTWRGHFYGDSDGQGFLDSGGNWSLLLDSSKRLKVYAGVYNGDSGIRVVMPGGAAYSTTTSTVTGAFKIKLPTARYKSDSMLRMTVKIYQYSTGQSLTFNIGGYNYNHATNTWLNIFAEQESDSNATTYTVRFGDDGTSNCIWIGETNTVWAYPQVFVSELEVGYSGTTSAWASGWSITAVTAFDTVYTSRTPAVKLTSNNVGTYGVSSITGTSNQVIASSSTGAVTLSLPQNIHTGATPTFSTLTLGGDVLTFSGGGVSAYNTSTARIYNQAGVGPTINGAQFQVRTGSSGTLGFSVDGSQNATVAGNLTVSGRDLTLGSSESVIYFGTPSANYLYYNGSSLFLRVGSVDRITIPASTGNLLLGTTTDLNRLTVVKDAAGSDIGAGDGQVMIAGATNTNKRLAIGFNTTSDYGWLQAGIAGTAYKNIVLNNNGGNVLIGTTTDGGQKLQVAGTASFTGTTSNNGTLIYRAANPYVDFYDGGGVGSGTIRAEILADNDGVSGGNFKILTRAAGGPITLAATFDKAQNTTLAGNLTVSGTGTNTFNGPISVAHNSATQEAFTVTNTASGGKTWVFGPLTGNAGFGIRNSTDAVNILSLSASTSGTTTISSNLAVNSSGVNNIGNTVNASLRIGNTGDQAAVISNTRRANYGDVMFAKNLQGQASSDSYTTVATSAATGYAGFEARYGGVARILVGSGATTADAVVTPTAAATFDTSGASITGNLTVSGTTSTFGGTAANNSITVSRITTGPSSVALQAFTNAPAISSTSDTASGYTWNRLISNGSEIVRVHNANLAAISAVAGSGISVSGGIIAATNITAGTSSKINWASAAQLESPSNGIVKISSDAGSYPGYLNVAGIQSWDGVIALSVGTGTGHLTANANLTVTGNLIVNGTTTTVDSTTLTTKDPIITLGGGSAGTAASSDDNKDRGIEFKWHNGTAAKTGFFGFDDSTGYFTFIPDATNTSEVFSGTQGDIQATNFRGNLIGNVTGNVSGTAGGETLATVTSRGASTSTAVTLSNTGNHYAGHHYFDAWDAAGNHYPHYQAGSDGTGAIANIRVGQSGGTHKVFILNGKDGAISWNGNAILHAGNYTSYVGNGTLTLAVSGTGLSGSASFTANQSGATTFTVTSNATNANTANTIVARDGSGNFSAGTITANSITGVLYARNTVNNNLGSPTVDEKALFHGQFNNKLRFVAPYLQEQSTDGSTWTTSTRASSQQLLDLMIGEGTGTSFTAIPAPGTGNAGYYRLTWNVTTVGYCYLDAVYFYCSTNGNTVTFKVEARDNGNSTWSTIATGNANNWPGHVYIPHSTLPAGANNATAGYYDYVRVTFTITSAAAYGTGFQLYMAEWWGGYPASRRNVEWHDSAKNVWWPAKVYGTQFVDSESTGFYLDPGATSNLTGLTVTNTISGSINGNASTATTLQTARTIAGVSFNGSANITLTGQNISTGTGTAANDLEVAKYLRWKNYGNNHVLIDASAGTNPAGGAIDRYTPGNTINSTGAGSSSWGEAISLMGWNGSATYGVRVDRARSIDNQANSATITATSANTASQIVQRDASGNFSAGTITATLAGLATSETLSTVTGRGASTSTQISVGTSAGGSMFTGTKQGSGYSDQVSGATFKSITENPNGGSYAFAAYYGGAPGTGTNSFFVGASGDGYFRSNVGIGTTGPTAKLQVVGSVFFGTGTYEQPGILTISQSTSDLLSLVNAGIVKATFSIPSQTGSSRRINLVDTDNSSVKVMTWKLDGTGNVGIGTETPGYKLEVNGSFAATTKSFVIKHPTKEGKKLRYGSLEGPENGVYVRGRLKGSNTIDLPDYWEKLVDPDSITVNLTPVGKHQKLYVESVSYKHVVVEKDGLFSGEIDCFYTVFAERIDVEKLQVEIDA